MPKVIQLINLVILMRQIVCNIEINELKNPIVETFSNNTIVMGSDLHILELRLDVSEILKNLEEIEKEIEQALSQLSKNMASGEIKVRFKADNSVQLMGEKIRELMSNNLYRIKLRMSIFLVKIKHIKRNFVEFLHVKLNHEKIEILKEMMPEKNWQETFKENMIDLGISELLIEYTRNTSHDLLPRSKREIAEYPINTEKISSLLGEADLKLGKVHVADPTFASSLFSNPNENMRININRMYNFDNQLLNSLNITQSYLQRSARLQRKLISLTADLARLELQLENEQVEIEITISYILNLINLQDISIQLERNLDDLKKAISNQYLTEYFLGVTDLREYLNQFTKQTGFLLPTETDKMVHLIYNYIPVEVTSEEKQIIYRIKIPIKDPFKSEIQEFVQISIKGLPFIRGKYWVNLDLTDGEDYILEVNSETGIPLDMCSGRDQIWYCDPDYFKPLPCAAQIFNYANITGKCKIKEDIKQNFFKSLGNRHFALGLTQPTELKITCTELESRRKVEVQKIHSEDKYLEASIYEMEISNNCELNFSLAYVPKRENIYEIKTKHWERITLDFDNETYFWENQTQLTDGLLGNFVGLRQEFDRLLNEFAESNLPTSQGTPVDVFIIVQTTQIIIFLGIFAITLSVCFKKWKSKRNKAQIAMLGPNPKDFVVIKDLDIKEEMESMM